MELIKERIFENQVKLKKSSNSLDFFLWLTMFSVVVFMV